MDSWEAIKGANVEAMRFGFSARIVMFSAEEFLGTSNSRVFVSESCADNLACLRLRRITSCAPHRIKPPGIINTRVDRLTH